MISAARFFGGARLLTLAGGASARIHPTVAKLWSVKPTGSGAVVSVPKGSEMLDTPCGRHQLAVRNVGSASFDVENANGDALATVAVGEIALLSCASTTENSGFGDWIVEKKAES